MFMSALAQNTQPLQLEPKTILLFLRVGWKPVAQRSISKTQLESVDHVGVAEPTGFQVFECFGCGFERLVVKANHSLHHRLVIGICVCNLAELPSVSGTFGCVDCGHAVIPQQLDRVTEAHRFSLHHPIDDATARLTSPEAVPQVLAR